MIAVVAVVRVAGCFEGGATDLGLSDTKTIAGSNASIGAARLSMRVSDDCLMTASRFALRLRGHA
jgi:hypothetical protein